LDDGNSYGGWGANWRHWFIAHRHDAPVRMRRSHLIERAVRRAVGRLGPGERQVIERYYYLGRSFDSIAKEDFLSMARVRAMHRRALGHLRLLLAPLAQFLFGVGQSVDPDCPICTASWRHDAEEILDEKTAEMTWGQMAMRLERAVGWRPGSPQTLIGHQRHHRRFTILPLSTDETDASDEEVIHDRDN